MIKNLTQINTIKELELNFKPLTGAPRPRDTTMSCDRVHQVLKKEDSNDGLKNQVKLIFLAL